MLTSYEALLKDVLKNGRECTDRTGTGTLSVFGRQVHYDLSKSFPLITTKKVYWKAIVHELLWFLQGSTNTKYLVDNGVTIWDEWANEKGDLGPVYGKQWRSWEKYELLALEGQELPSLVVHEVDQIAEVIKQIKSNPDSRRLIVNAWNVSDLDKMALPPCHMFFQFKVYGDELECQLYQRSADMFLGVPFNIASYALLTHLIAAQTGLKATKFVHSIGDAHIYTNHVDQVKEQLARNVRKMPSIKIREGVESIFDYKFEDIELVGYNPHPAIKAQVSV